LSGVACPATTRCTAIGGYTINGGHSFTLAEIRNG
jgi:hypothetical protein